MRKRLRKDGFSSSAIMALLLNLLSADKQCLLSLFTHTFRLC
jgi:hypothetical protein